MEKTMLGISYDLLNEKQTATFKQIYAAVAKELKSSWKKQTPKKLMEQIENEKRAELYTLITVSGEFVKVTDSKFGLIKDFTFEEVSKMKVNPEEEL